MKEIDSESMNFHMWTFFKWDVQFKMSYLYWKMVCGNFLQMCNVKIITYVNDNCP